MLTRGMQFAHAVQNVRPIRMSLRPNELIGSAFGDGKGPLSRLPRSWKLASIYVHRGLAQKCPHQSSIVSQLLAQFSVPKRCLFNFGRSRSAGHREGEGVIGPQVYFLSVAINSSG